MLIDPWVESEYPTFEQTTVEVVGNLIMDEMT